jgi:hypothetical protein
MRYSSLQLEALETVISALKRKPSNSKITTQLELLLARLKKQDAPKPKPGIGIDRAISAMRAVLGDKLAVPPNPSSEWCIYLARRIRTLGLTEDDCKKIAKCVAIKWNPPYGFEYCIKAADRLLAESSSAKKQSKTTDSSPVEMDDSWE